MVHLEAVLTGSESFIHLKEGKWNGVVAASNQILYEGRPQTFLKSRTTGIVQIFG